MPAYGYKRALTTDLNERQAQCSVNWRFVHLVPRVEHEAKRSGVLARRYLFRRSTNVDWLESRETRRPACHRVTFRHKQAVVSLPAQGLLSARSSH